MTALRLDRLLSNLGYGSRKEIQMLASRGRITLDGEALREADGRITLEANLPERLRVDGEPLDPLPGLTLLLHKPVGVTCSHKEAGTLVYELLPERWRRRDPALSTIGRLDKETSGLLLVTDDGMLLHKVISPKHHVEKRYRVTLARPLRGDEAALFSSGTLMLEGEQKPLLPAQMTMDGPQAATLIITEGRYHQVRRMFAAIGNHVETLHRDRVGALELPADLPAGEFMILPDAEQRIFMRD
ncbi:MAG: rRNA pseudouridine synthase [Proteobacteria bacterium]|nr:rRNA pseudouridine synthase [Pseudomonadota bacterium]